MKIPATTITGILTNPDFQATLKVLQKQAGAQMMNGPEVVILTGEHVNAMDKSVVSAMQKKLALNESVVTKTNSAPDADRLVQEGKLDYEMGKLDEAEKLFKSALASDSENTAVKYYLGLVQAARESSKTNEIPFPARIPVASESTTTFKVDHPINLNDLKKSMLDAGVAVPPTLFFDKDNGLLLVRGSNEQLALVHRLVLKLNGASTNEIETASKRFESSVQASSTTDETATNLFTRIFKVDPNMFTSNIRSVLGLQTNDIAAMLQSLLNTLGVNLDSSKGEAIFYSYRKGMLLVKATESDLDAITTALQVLNSVPPQIHIKARFVEVPNGTYKKLVVPNLLTNSLVSNPKLETNVWQGLLSAEKLKTVLQALAAKPGIMSLGEPEGTTMSGRQMLMRATTMIEVATNLAIGTNAGSFVPQTKKVETGPELDVVPYVLSDGYTINLALIPSDTEFLGYILPQVTGNLNVVQFATVSPKLTVRGVVTAANVWDGQTVVIGGLASSPVLVAKNKVPVWGDLPLFGRFFQSESKTTGEKELLVFITATIVDPAGNRVHSDDELDVVLTQPTQPEQIAHPAGGRNQFNDKLRADTDGTPPQPPPSDTK